MVCVHSIHLLLKYSLFKEGITKVFKIKKQENISKSLWKMKLKNKFILVQNILEIHAYIQRVFRNLLEKHWEKTMDFKFSSLTMNLPF